MQLDQCNIRYFYLTWSIKPNTASNTVMQMTNYRRFVIVYILQSSRLQLGIYSIFCNKCLNYNWPFTVLLSYSTDRLVKIKYNLIYKLFLLFDLIFISKQHPNPTFWSFLIYARNAFFVRLAIAIFNLFLFFSDNDSITVGLYSSIYSIR